jgi:hypothetical protein
MKQKIFFCVLILKVDSEQKEVNEITGAGDELLLFNSWTDCKLETIVKRNR